MINVRKTLEAAQEVKPAGAAVWLPDVTLDAGKIYAVMINEVTPPDPRDDFYGNSGGSEYLASALALFRRAGADFASAEEITAGGIYMTNAVKLPKTGYDIEKIVIEENLPLLEAELSLFQRLKVIMLMGDVAKKAFNLMAKRETGKNVIPPISTYKLRNSEFFYNGIRVLPSYIMTGRNLLIEKSKAEMAAADIRKMMDIIG